MLKIRRSGKSDQNTILDLLREIDLHFASQSLENFWVAEKHGRIIGVVQFEEFANFYFLSSLGVVENERKNRVAAALLQEILRDARKDVYLYTIIPDFFTRFGFKIVPAPDFLPAKKPFCMECYPDKCVTMVRNPTIVGKPA